VKRLIPQFKKLTAEVFTVVTSRGGLKALLHDPLYSNAIYLMLASIITSLFGFVFWIIAVRFYSTTDVGLATAALSAASLLATLSGIGLGYGLIRFLKSNTDPNPLINSSFTTAGIIAVIVALIFILGLNKWSPALVFIRENAFYFVAFVLITYVFTISGLMDQIFVAGRRTSYILVKNLIFNILRLILLVALATVFHSFGIFASWGISTSMALLIGIFLFLPQFHFRYRPRLSFKRKILAEVLQFSFMNYIGDIFGSAPSYILPILVVNVLGAESNAYSYIAWTIGGLLSMIPSAISTSLFAEGSHKEECLDQNVVRSLKLTFLLLIPAVILVLAFADKILLLYGGLYSQNATNLLRLIAVAALPLSINSIYMSIKRVQKRLKIIVGLSAFIGVVTIVLSYILLPYADIAGAGIAWLTTHCCISLVIVASWLKNRRMSIIPN
jgi:O-antigen/teichoic acid export membrane protein